MDRVTERRLLFLRTQYTARELEARLGLSPKDNGRIVRLWTTRSGTQRRNPSKKMISEIARVYQESSAFVDATAFSHTFSPSQLEEIISPVVEKVYEFSYRLCIENINAWIENISDGKESSAIFFNIGPYLRQLSYEKRYEHYSEEKDEYYIGILDMRSSVNVLRLTTVYIHAARPGDQQFKSWLSKLLGYVGPGAYLIRDRRLRSYLQRWLKGETV